MEPVPEIAALAKLTPEVMAAMPRRAKEMLLDALGELERRRNRRKFFTLFPENGPLRRALYPRHMEFFKATKDYAEIGAICANRIGKTYGMGGYAATVFTTGMYPKWWEGRVFDKPVDIWVAGKTNETTRDIIQKKLLGGVVTEGGRKVFDGTGLIPGDLLGLPTWKQGIPNLVDTIPVKHVPSGRWSVIGLKSYDQGRRAFEGTEKDLIWLDEEPPADVYDECLIRTATTDGLILCTFTPLDGISDVVLSFLPEEMRPARGD